jgi:adenylate cyclase
MGDVVNLASRLEGANKMYGLRTLVSERTLAGAGDAVEFREIDRIVVAGQTRSETVFEILGPKGELTQQQQALRNKYLEGLAAYRERRWDDALLVFNASLEVVPDDGPSLALIKRIESFRGSPPLQDWNGSWHIEK